MIEKQSGERATCLRLVVLSFISLFLELMLIRWAPSVVRLVAYFSNLLLISSFLGLAIGAMLATRRSRLFGWFPLLLAADIGLLLVCTETALPGSGSEYRFYAEVPRAVSYAILVSIFAANVLLFVPLGQEIGSLFHALSPLRAYTWDLGGSLAGTLSFGDVLVCVLLAALGNVWRDVGVSDDLRQPPATLELAAIRSCSRRTGLGESSTGGLVAVLPHHGFR